jgi:site-specific DNA-methyltransferase (cytosine-N4-specific)
MRDHEMIIGDSRQALDTLDKGLFRTCITSPPYWQLRDYDALDQIGVNGLMDYIVELGDIFEKVRNCLADDGTLWLNLGDTYAGGGGYSPGSPSNVKGSKQSTNRGALAKSRPVPEGRKRKDLLGVPWLAAFELQRRGWYLRADVIWEKTNCLPESVTDRPVRSHEYVFLFSKKPKYFFNAEVLYETKTNGEGKRNGRSVWSIPKQVSGSQHTAVFPEELVRRCLLSSTEVGDRALDPFMGSGTVQRVARKFDRKSIGIEINEDYTRDYN